MPNTDLLEVDCDPKIPDDAEDVGAVEEPDIDLLDVDCDCDVSSEKLHS